MVSVARSILLRQTAALAAPASRLSARSSPVFGRRNVALQQSLFRSGANAAAFHASSNRSLLPPGPQVIQGTVNDAAPVPATSPSHGSYHWTFERLVAAGLVPLTLAPFAAGSLNPTLDAVLCATLLVHSHLGFQSIVADYVPTRRFPFAGRLAKWVLNAATIVVGIGLYEFETNDVGLTETVKCIWKA